MTLLICKILAVLLTASTDICFPVKDQMHQRLVNASHAMIGQTIDALSCQQFYIQKVIKSGLTFRQKCTKYTDFDVCTGQHFHDAQQEKYKATLAYCLSLKPHEQIGVTKSGDIIGLCTDVVTNYKARWSWLLKELPDQLTDNFEEVYYKLFPEKRPLGIDQQAIKTVKYILLLPIKGVEYVYNNLEAFEFGFLICKFLLLPAIAFVIRIKSGG